MAARDCLSTQQTSRTSDIWPYGKSKKEETKSKGEVSTIRVSEWGKNAPNVISRATMYLTNPLFVMVRKPRRRLQIPAQGNALGRKEIS